MYSLSFSVAQIRKRVAHGFLTEIIVNAST